MASLFQKYRDDISQVSPQEMNKMELLDETREWSEDKLISEMMRELGISDNMNSNKRKLQELLIKVAQLKVNNQMYREALDERNLIIVEGEINARGINTIRNKPTQ